MVRKMRVSLQQLCIALCVTTIALSLFPCMAAASVPKGWAAGWSAINNLATTSLNSGSPAVVIDPTDIFHIVFTNSSVTEHWFVYKQIDINGDVLQSRVIYRTRFTLSNPQLVRDRKNNLHLVWEEHRPGQRGIYHIVVSNDHDKEDPRGRLISFDTKYAIHPSLSIDGAGNIYIFWSDLRAGNWEIFLSKLDGEGIKLINQQRITYTATKSLLPAAIVDNKGELHLVWKEECHLAQTAFAYFMTLDTQMGTPIEAPQRLGQTRFVRETRGPQIITNRENNLYVVWNRVVAGTGAYERLRLVVTEILPDGRFKPRVTVGTGSTHSPYITLAQDGQVAVAWAQTAEKRLYIYYALIEEGEIVQQATRLSIEECGGRLPVILVDSNNRLHLFWKDIIDAGRSHLLYMNTVSPASPSVWARLGLDAVNPFYAVIQLCFHGVMTLGATVIAIVLSLPAIALTFLFGIFLTKIAFTRRVSNNQFLLLIMLLVTQLLLLSLVGPAIPYLNLTHRLTTIAVSFLLVALFRKVNTLNLHQALPMVTSIVLWTFWYLFFNLIFVPIEMIL
ncbi:hypothetical protein LM599_01250 [Candidatus Acetothermia bacterium]|nr:hypothetical protein [Candidatus Acetothermia bacterium]MCI2427416.1 hypothetical protein [Candidatus Acetothermia bacterium]